MAMNDTTWGRKAGNSASKGRRRKRAPNKSHQLQLIPLRQKRVGRNNPCPCGSGKKFKKCCLIQPTKGGMSLDELVELLNVPEKTWTVRCVECLEATIECPEWREGTTRQSFHEPEIEKQGWHLLEDHVLNIESAIKCGFDVSEPIETDADMAHFGIDPSDKGQYVEIGRCWVCPKCADELGWHDHE
jgi:SEC-C motif-containing protein